MAFFLKIGYFARFDIQKDMQQDTLYFCAGIALCFDELNDIRQVVAGVNGMQNTVFQSLRNLRDIPYFLR